MSSILDWWPERRGDWFFTVSGKRQYILRPSVMDINIADIGGASAKICRFGGHCLEFYSVAQHAVLVSTILRDVLGRPDLAFEGLLHDSAEAYLGDVIRPLKRELRRYRRIEHIWESAICERFGLSFLMTPEIKTADLIALATERKCFAPHIDPTVDPSAWRWKEDELGVEALSTPLVAMDWRTARDAFLNRFYSELYARRAA